MRCEHSGVVSSTCWQRRHSSELGGEPVTKRRIEPYLVAVRLLSDREFASFCRSGLPQFGLNLPHDLARVLVAFGAHVEPGSDSRGDGIRTAWHRNELADRGTRAFPARGGAPGREYPGGDGDQRIVPVGHCRATGVIALAAHVNPPTSVLQDARRHPDRLPERFECTPLFHVELDEQADAPQRLAVLADVLDVEPEGCRSLPERQAITVAQGEGTLWRELARHEAGAEARDPEAGTLLLREDDDREGASGSVALRLQQSHRVQSRRDAQRSIERATAGNRVEVASRHNRIRPGFTPPRPDVAVPIDLEVEPQPQRALREPVAQRALGVVEHVPREAAPLFVDADVGDLVEELERGAPLGHSPSHIGTRSPRSLAMSAACS